MAIGARDKIDRLLVQKYADEQVDNHEIEYSMVDAKAMMTAMNDYASVQRNMVALSQRLRMVCYSVNASNASYRSIRPLKGAE